MYCILIYDIKKDEKSAMRSRKIFNTAKRYLVHIQKSIFEGEISNVQYVKLTKELKEYLNYEEDSCIMFKSRSEKWMNKEFLTIENDETSNFI